MERQWSTKYIETSMSFADLVNEAARWGADQELDACIEWLRYKANMEPAIEPLSAAAQAVLDAANYVYDRAGTTGHGLAAALRAVVDQVTPEDFDYWYGSAGDYASGCETGQNERNAQVRAELLAIANELEGHEALI